MIGRAARLTIRCLIETAIILLVASLLVGYVAWRIGRRLWRDDPDRLEQLSGHVEKGMEALPNLARAFRAAGE